MYSTKTLILVALIFFATANAILNRPDNCQPTITASTSDVLTQDAYSVTVSADNLPPAALNLPLVDSRYRVRIYLNDTLVQTINNLAAPLGHLMVTSNPITATISGPSRLYATIKRQLLQVIPIVDLTTNTVTVNVGRRATTLDMVVTNQSGIFFTCHGTVIPVIPVTFYPTGRFDLYQDGVYYTTSGLLIEGRRSVSADTVFYPDSSELRLVYTGDDNFLPSENTQTVTPTNPDGPAAANTEAAQSSENRELKVEEDRDVGKAAISDTADPEGNSDAARDRRRFNRKVKNNEKRDNRRRRRRRRDVEENEQE